MSGFEFVLVLYAIIAGLGISDILQGWGEQIRARQHFSPYPLQIALSFLLMFYGMTFLWAMWTFREMKWTFALYAALAVLPLVISLASRVIRLDTAEDAPLARDQYMQNAGPVYLLLASIPAMLIVLSLASPIRDIVSDAPNLIGVTAVRVTACSALIYIAWSKNEKVHWIGIFAMFLLVLALSIRLTDRAIEGGI